MRRALLCLAGALVILGLVTLPAAIPPATDLNVVLADTGPPRPHGPAGKWRLRFKDEFAGDAVDWSRWSDSSSALSDDGRGGKPNDQLEFNQRQNCSVSDDRLTITAKPDSVVSPSGIRYDWSSCLLSSSPSYAFRFGYLETRARFPPEKGFWPAFWTWQVAERRIWTETDVFEYYSDNRERLYLTQHSGPGGQCIVTDLGFDPSAGFHRYGADIHPGGTDYYVDGRKVCTVPGTSTGRTNIVLDMFVYAKVPPEPGTTARMHVDYVRAWSRLDGVAGLPVQTLPQASRRARTVLTRRFGREFTRRDPGYRGRCRRRSPAVATCDVRWSNTSFRYAGTVRITATTTRAGWSGRSFVSRKRK